MLDERKRRILQAVVDDYISSAEPVGSRTVARRHDLGVSPATIRNEMADLEDMGYLEHLHTSSGRIPSSKGYRLYVDDLLSPAPIDERERALIDDWYRKRVKRIESIFQETARIISRVTKNLALVLAPQLAEASFRTLQFLPLGEERVIAVLMTDAGFAENRVVKMPRGASFQDFQRMAEVINRCLSGEKLSSIGTAALKRIRAEVMDESLYQAAMELIYEALDEERKEQRLYLGGTTEMLAQPEFRDVTRVRALLSLLEEENFVKDVLQKKSQEGLVVTIGRENEYSGIEDCSIIRATYHLDGECLGTIAVLGPTRMEYGKAMALLGYLNRHSAALVQPFRWERQSMKYEVKGMPSFMKDEMKKKDEEKLEEMKREIDEAEAAEAAEATDELRSETAEESPAGFEEAAESADEAKDREKLEADLQEKDAQMLRLRADFDNFRRRSAKEREELAAVVTQGILADMLPLLDNFERALAAGGSDLESFRAGVSMIYKQMQEALAKNGLEVIDTKDKKFDPNFHQAVMRVQDPEKEDDTIEQELQKGYMVKGRVIRPSMVQVVSN